MKRRVLIALIIPGLGTLDCDRGILSNYNDALHDPGHLETVLTTRAKHTPVHRALATVPPSTNKSGSIHCSTLRCH
jgi:hypothetical protein